MQRRSFRISGKRVFAILCVLVAGTAALLVVWAKRAPAPLQVKRGEPVTGVILD